MNETVRQEATTDVVGIGNAIVDVIVKVSDEFVESEGLVKGSMSLIDEARAIQLYGRIGPALEASGGSAGNTMAGVASFGGQASYIGKVADDQLGEVFAHDLEAVGVSFPMGRFSGGPATARSMILVSPDGQRTMNTFLGISSLLEPSDIDRSVVEAGSILFCEGYLWDVDSAKAAIRKALDYAHAAGRTTSLTLSDSFCIERHHAEFTELVAGPVDIAFANLAELAALYGTDNLDEGISRLQENAKLACVTMGAKGSLLITPDEVVEVAAHEVAEVVDTTGAGDQYAAGVLYGLSQGYSLRRCGELGSLAAAEVITHVGPRPCQSLAVLASLEFGSA